MAIRIMLIDDDSDDRALFREAVEEVSPDAICVTEADSRKALSELFCNESQLPNIIFLDINMPKFSGWDCLKQIKSHEKTREIPVMMYSTSSHEREVEKASVYGATCLITKPGNYKELKRCLKEIIKKLLEDGSSFSKSLASYTF